MMMIKRLFDILFSFSILLLGAPIFLLIALCVKCSSKGPILYKSMRVKRNFATFSCYKFRTMTLGANEQLEQILKNPQKKREFKEFDKLKEDPRVTKLGTFLRFTSLDELPQFWNVLKGDMSVVGPRPIEVKQGQEHVFEEMNTHFMGHAATILSIKPGITGLWQTSGRNTLNLRQRTLLDLIYVQRQSFWFDLQLIFKTVPLVLKPKGAF